MTQTDEEIYHALGLEDQYCENDYTIQSNLQIQCNLYQTTNGIFHRTKSSLEQKVSQFVFKHKRPPTAKAILRKKKELEESTFLTSDNTTKLQSSRQYGTGSKRDI